jgi:5-methylcytosine-specific restriction endonuclease McrA
MPSRDHGKAYRRRLKVEVLNVYSAPFPVPTCLKCGTDDIDAAHLQIDHVNGGGNKHRVEVLGRLAGGHPFYLWLRRNGYPSGYQTLCRRCNLNKRNTTDKQGVNNESEIYDAFG